MMKKYAATDNKIVCNPHRNAGSNEPGKCCQRIELGDESKQNHEDRQKADHNPAHNKKLRRRRMSRTYFSWRASTVRRLR